MIKVLDYQTVTPEWWLTVISGMRHPLKSYKHSDSTICEDIEYKEECERTCPHARIVNVGTDQIVDCWNRDLDRTIVLGKKDLNLMKALIKAGSSDRKFLRQIPVIITIKAPEYWWRQMDQYKVGTTTNSASQMHRLAKDGVSIEDFSIEDQEDTEDLTDLIDKINSNLDSFNETKDEKYFRKAIQLIPQSFNYVKTWTGSYENLRSIYQERSRHKLKEWRDFCEWITSNVPFSDELIIS